MKIISFKEIENLNLTYLELYKWIKEVITIKEETILPPKISMKMEGHKFFNVMPSIIPSIGASGMKVVTRFPEREPALKADILLYDSNSGELLSMMDGTYITTMRTGAMAALAINTLAKKDYEEIAMIGLGNTARATLLILLATNPNKQFKIKLLAFNNDEKKFMERFSEYKNIEFIVVNNNEDLIKNSDVIISCVTAIDGNIGEDSWFKKGVLVVPVHTMGFQNCDLFFDRVIVDDIGHVDTFKYFDKFKYCAELTKVLKDNKLGRTTDDERILAYNIGISIEDVYYAKKIYDLIDKTTDELNKYWV